ncbi:MAG: hypothetical protein EBT33_15835 [Betaproteobacteria bacterium]|nr:hypothetical protein [Betaproteobacteria bacterium]
MYSPGKYKYASTFDLTTITIMVGPCALLRQCHVRIWLGYRHKILRRLAAHQTGVLSRLLV